jgi:hypothetical protein
MVDTIIGVVFWVVVGGCILAGIGSGFYALAKARTAMSGIKNGIPSLATIESVADTGLTITTPSIGPDAADFKMGLLVMPPGGGEPYRTEIEQAIPRVARAMIVPGATVGVLIDPANPGRVRIDWQNVGGSAAAFAAAGGAGSPPPGGFTMSFDAAGNPTMDLGKLVSGVRSGSLNTIRGSAAQLLATGTHGVAVVTTAQPLGKKVRDVNPAAEPSKLDDPMWLFTVEVTLPGQAPFPAIFGHRVPVSKVAEIAPGIGLTVAVDESDRNEEVAIDWERSPVH